MSDYYLPSSDTSISADALKEADRETQLEVVETWFRQRFEDPAERTPYESAEGGYIWIWGGPFDAREEIEQEFYDLLPEDVLLEVIETLEMECAEWAPTEKPSDYDDSLFEDIARITEYYSHFSDAILDIESLLNTKVPSSVESHFYRLLYVNVITALETYLSDAFINTVATNPPLMRRFVETNPDFQSQKVPLSQVFRALAEIDGKARAYLIDIVWHHLPRAEKIYKSTLDVTFDRENRKILINAVLVRHDIIHRNGKTKDGEDLLILKQGVVDLIQTTETFVQHIDKQIAEVRKRVAEEAKPTKPG